MKIVFLLAAFVHAALSGKSGAPTSLLSPAGVTYVDGSYHAGLAAGPVGYSGYSSAPVPAVRTDYSVSSAPVAAAPTVYASAPAVATGSLSYSAPAASVATVASGHSVYASAPAVATGAVSYSAGVAAAPVATAVSAAPAVYSSAPAVPASIAYAAPATKYAAIPTVQNVPAVADIPVTRINAQPGVIQKTVDVASPAVKTQRFEVRRPAIQKQFYDIEERVVVRPAGSAVVELDEPVSKTQKGPSVIQPAGGSAVTSQSVVVPTGPGVSGATSDEYAVGGNSVTSVLPPAPPAQTAPLSAPVYSAQGSAVLPPASQVHSGPVSAPVHSVPVSAPVHSVPVSAPVHSVSVSAPVHSVPVSAPVQTVSVAPPAPTVSGVSTISAGSSGHNSYPYLPSQVSFSTPAPTHFSDDSVTVGNADFNLARANEGPRPAYYSAASSGQEHRLNELSRTVYQSVPQHVYSAPVSAAAVPSRSTVFRAPSHSPSYDFVPQQSFSAASGSSQSQVNHENQQKLIQLLTARGGVTEVGFGRSGSAASYPVQAGPVRGRVVSATPAPAYAAPTGERVNTRRVVVSRPVETLQEVEVSQPVTKYERVQVSQPTVIKTATQDVVRVPTSVPVYGKAFAPIAEESYSTLSSDWQ